MGDIGAFMRSRWPGFFYPAALRGYIESTVEFIGAHRAAMKALLEIFLNGGFRYDAGAERAVVSPRIEDVLRAGQRSGEFRVFDVTVMATLIQRAVDGLPFLLDAQPDVKRGVAAFTGAEVATTFELATRAGPAAS